MSTTATPVETGRIPFEAVPFILAGAVPLIGNRAEELAGFLGGREDELCDLTRDACALADWCTRLYDRVDWSGVTSVEPEARLYDARDAAIQLAGVALLIGSNCSCGDARRARAELSLIGNHTRCPLANALLEAGRRLQEYALPREESES